MPTQDLVASLVAAERARAECLLNNVRAAVVILLAIAAAVYAPSISPALRNVNTTVVTTMLVWTLAQLRWHRGGGRVPAWVAAVNPVVDITAVTVLLLGYAIESSPAMALRAPVFLAYVVIIAARPLTGSTRQAVFTVGLAMVEYAALAAFLLRSANSGLPTFAPTENETGSLSVLDEGTRLAFLAVIGGLAIWATAWHERLLRRALEMQVVRAAEELDMSAKLQEADKLAALGTLAASLAHDVNNPLAVIAMTADLMKGSTVGETKEDATLIADEARRISKIVKDLLSFARRSEVVHGPVSLYDVADGALGMLRPMLRDHRIIVQRQLVKVPPIEGDSSRLERVVLNLLINAVQALDVASSAVLGRNAAPKTVRVSCGQNTSDVWLAVEDNGPGFSSATADQLFERFFTTKPAGKGTGLGLWIVRQIIEEHGGTIVAAPRADGGASFTIRLPISTDEVAEAPLLEPRVPRVGATIA